MRERAMLLGLWHATNELNALRKLVLLVSNNKAKGSIERSAKAFEAILLIKMFAVKATEAWKLFDRAKNFPEFKQKYLAHEESADLIKAKDWLEDYFGKPNILKRVRKKFGAHYDFDVVSKGASDLRKLDSFIFLTEQQGNSLYWVAEELQLRALAEVGNPGESVASIYDRLLTDVNDVAAHSQRWRS